MMLWGVRRPSSMEDEMILIKLFVGLVAYHVWYVTAILNDISEDLLIWSGRNTEIP